MATPAHPSSRVDMQGTVAPFYFSPSRHGWRTWRPNSETKAPPSAFPVRSSPETASASASRAHADVAKGANDTSSPSSHRSRLKRRLSVPRDDSASDSKPILYRGNNYEDITGSPRRRIRRSPPAYPARHRERGRRSSRAPPPRDQQAPRRTSSYKPYDGRDQRGQGHRGHEKRQGYRGDDHGPRGYAKPKFPVQQVCSDPYGPREDSYGGRQQIPAQEAPNGGYHQYREPPRVHFPAGFIQRSHPYVSAEDGAFDGTKKNPGNQRAVRDENRPDQHRRRRNRRQYYKDPYSQSPSGLS
ncbi:RNA-binding motif protein, X chromosome-like [Brachypodium distachyon]|uniref:RNA-binding motif protein, X chromosome-like n=1 Tax=Brachypodium distachyon TaxID=15368 RepID=UPI00052FFD6C|nr:RNA-binding motif protein, X chromosome-like [Brachypodium distachyon]|eukprot:XP_010233214.1 RNA-binding motif protein, X chromosome-like [Brachypodium distachyon]